MTRFSRRSSRRRGSDRALLGTIGLITIVALVVGVYVSYNANSGLPFEKTYRFTVELPDANRLVQTNQVRIGGVRIGKVERVDALPASADDDSSEVRATAVVKLPADAARVPVDSTISVRPASVLGATYLDIAPGRSSRTVPDGGRMPLARAEKTVEVTDLLDVFDARTSKNIQQAVREVGGGLVGRGGALGEAITEANGLVGPLKDVTANLADPRTKLSPLIESYEALIATIASERQAMGRFTTGGARTFGALSRARDALGRTFDEFPAAADTTTNALARIRPSLDRLAVISARLRPSAEDLPRAMESGVALLRAATPAFDRMKSGSPELGDAADALRRFGTSPDVDGLLRKVGDTVQAAAPALATSAEAQKYCNVFGVFGENFFDTFASEGIGEGPAVIGIRLRQLGISPVESLQNSVQLPNLHTNYLPNQNRNECEAGNESFSTTSQSLVNPPGFQSRIHPKTEVLPELTRQAESVGLLRPAPAPIGR